MRKRILVLTALLTVSVMVSLTGCGKGSTANEHVEIPDRTLNEQNEEENIVGADWRTWGLISDYLTVKTADDELDLALCYMGEPGNYKNIDIYEDSSDQNLITSIEVPVEGIGELKVSAVDLDGDELDDLSIYGKDLSGGEYTWFYVQTDNEDFFVPYEEGDQEEEEGAKEAGLKSVDYDLSLYDDKDEYLYFECKGNNYLCTDDHKKQFPKLAQKLEEIAANEQENGEMYSKASMKKLTDPQPRLLRMVVRITT